MNDRSRFTIVAAAFLAAWSLPVETIDAPGPVLEALAMLHEYARDHVLLCLVPAFFLAGAISVFVSQASVMKYLGAGAPKRLAYPVGAVSGAILAVCSCTVLPLFAGIHKRGAGLGPAVAFLYSGPAINILAIVLTARVLGLELGIARVAGAVSFSVAIGLLMHLLFRSRGPEERRPGGAGQQPAPSRALWQDGLYFAGMAGFLVFANWGRPQGSGIGLWSWIYEAKWAISFLCLAAAAGALALWFRREELARWLESTWGFAKQILPLLFGGVLLAGFLLGRPGYEGLIPSQWVQRLVGGNSLRANLVASVAGAFMYFATLTEIPILQGLLGAGMGKGPALTLLLAGPALSLPSMLVIRSVLGSRRAFAYVALVVVLSSMAGLLYGSLSGGG